VARMLEGERQKLMGIEQRLRARVVGQDDALARVGRAVKRGRAGLQDPGRPIGSFIFLGPTGVGKTELAKALAEFLFDDEAAMVRLDMSEYMEKHAVARLTGAPPGYVGYDEGGQLTEAVRRRPYAVVLLDEVEKAHPDVFNVLLALLDDGRLTDAKGRTVSFANVVLIMTSNLGSQAIIAAGADRQAMRSEVQSALRAHFRPEFLNRIDETVVFDPLGPPQIAAIVELQVKRLARLLDEQRIVLELTPEARALVASESYDPMYGARPVKRTLQTRLRDPLAEKILAGEIVAGDTVVVGRAGDTLEFSKRMSAP
jgi:ATP-dependent Clp protease ATP-binding subunit ClpB